MTFPLDVHGFSPDESGPLVGVSCDTPPREVHVPDSALSRHLLALGRSGSGKSVLLRHILAHRLDRMAASRDDGTIVVIDPHGDLIRDVLPLVPPAVAGQVRLLDFGARDRFPAVNLLDPSLFPDRERCVDLIIDTFKYLWERWGSREEEIMRNGLMIAHEFNSHLDTIPEDLLTVLDVAEILQGSLQAGRDSHSGMSVFQRHVMNRVRDPDLSDWMQGFMGWLPATRSDALGLPLTCINSYSAASQAGLALGQRESLVTHPGLLGDGLPGGPREARVVLVSTAMGVMGRVPSALLGSAVVSLVESIPGVRDPDGGIPPSGHCLLVCEDFQEFPGTDWARLLSEGRRSGCSLLLSSQSLQDFGEGLAPRVLGGFGCIAGFQMAAADAGVVSFEMGLGDGGDRALANQSPFEFHLWGTQDSGSGVVRLLPPRPAVRGSGDSESIVRDASRSFTVDLQEARDRIDLRLSDRLSARTGQ